VKTIEKILVRGVDLPCQIANHFLKINSQNSTAMVPELTDERKRKEERDKDESK
jgi:hypothetical protein